MKKAFPWPLWLNYCKMNKNFLVVASLLGALTVALGAMAAHRLRETLPPNLASAFETGVRYQFYHVFALFIVGICMKWYSNRWMTRAGNCFILGIGLFSGSLYALALLKITESGGSKYIGWITPVGGLVLILGWIFLLVGFQHPDS
jgi:uncharacterized membrane protein YgdD (TMEM256/DUF423 family)